MTNRRSFLTRLALAAASLALAGKLARLGAEPMPTLEEQHGIKGLKVARVYKLNVKAATQWDLDNWEKLPRAPERQRTYMRFDPVVIESWEELDAR